MITLEIPESSRDIIERMFPGMEAESVQSINFGWTNQILVLGSKYVIKIPRYPEAAKWVEKEIEITTKLRGTIPVGIPSYVNTLYNGKLVAAAYEFMEGSLFTTQPVDGGIQKSDPMMYLSESSGHGIAKQLGTILSSIHDVAPNQVTDILKKYVDDDWDTKITGWIKQCRKTCEQVFSGTQKEKCGELLDSIETEFSDLKFIQKFIHGDFGGWNMLFDPEETKIIGILDWADARIGDPAKDFTELIYDFGRDFAGMILDHYGRNRDPRILDRAELYLKLNGFQDLEYGLEKKSAFFTERGKEAVLAELKKL